MKHIYSLFALLIISNLACAQVEDTTAEGQLDASNPTGNKVTRAYKLKLPKPDTLSTNRLAHNLNNDSVKLQEINFHYLTKNIEQFDPGIRLFPALPTDYVKVGGGWTSDNFYLGEISTGIVLNANPDFKTTLQGDYISLTSAVAGTAQERNSQTGDFKANIDIAAPRKFPLCITLAGNHDDFYYFGYDHNIHTLQPDSIHQSFYSGRVRISGYNKLDTGQHWTFSPQAEAGIFHAKNSLNEYSLNETVLASYQDNGNLPYKITCAFVTYYSDLVANNTHVDNYLSTADLLVNFGFFNIGNAKAAIDGYVKYLANVPSSTTRTNLLENLSACVSDAEGNIAVRGGYQSSIIQNTYEQLADICPYVTSNYSVGQTYKQDIFLALSKVLGHNVSLTVKADKLIYQQLPVFVDSFGLENQYLVRYEDVKAYSVSGIAAYRHVGKNTWSIYCKGSYNAFFDGSMQQPWGLPSIHCEGGAEVYIAQHFKINIQSVVLGGIHGVGMDGRAYMLDPIFNVSAEANYILPNNRFEVFLNGNNLLDQANERWNRYNAYSRGVCVGLTYKFRKN